MRKQTLSHQLSVNTPAQNRRVLKQYTGRSLRDSTRYIQLLGLLFGLQKFAVVYGGKAR